MTSDPLPSDTSETSWKERYAALKARLTAARTALNHSRQELDQARRALHVAEELVQAARVERETLRGRWHRHERQVLRPDVLADLMPPRARHRRETAPDELALRREAAHASASATYAAARTAEAPAGADRVDICGVTWWVPADIHVHQRARCPVAAFTSRQHDLRVGRIGVQIEICNGVPSIECRQVQS